MGLDIIEFVLGVEDALGVKIPNHDAARITTPRMLIDYLHGKLPQSPGPRCLSLRAFYRVRRALVERVNRDRSTLRPGTELLAILPPNDGHRIWMDIGKSLGVTHWPRIRGEGWLARTFLHGRPRTLGDAAWYIATVVPKALKHPDEGWSWNEVARVVDGQMRHVLGIKDYALDDRFVEDLRLD